MKETSISSISYSRVSQHKIYKDFIYRMVKEKEIWMNLSSLKEVIVS
jgi:hypothetical protein